MVPGAPPPPHAAASLTCSQFGLFTGSRESYEPNAPFPRREHESKISGDAIPWQNRRGACYKQAARWSDGGGLGELL